MAVRVIMATIIEFFVLAAQKKGYEVDTAGRILEGDSVQPATKEVGLTPLRSASLVRCDPCNSLGDYGRSDSVTIMGVWSDGFSCARGPLSISQLSSRSANVGDNRK
jgi:hypothetical protein